MVDVLLRDEHTRVERPLRPLMPAGQTLADQLERIRLAVARRGGK